jgi:hypothetical protein
MMGWTCSSYETGIYTELWAFACQERKEVKKDRRKEISKNIRRDNWKYEVASYSSVVYVCSMGVFL